MYGRNLIMPGLLFTLLTLCQMCEFGVGRVPEMGKGRTLLDPIVEGTGDFTYICKYSTIEEKDNGWEWMKSF